MVSKKSNTHDKVQVVIMVAGSSTRTRPLTDNKPKPLLKILNKAVLEHTIESLSTITDEIILIVNYKKEMIGSFIKTYLSKKYPKIRFFLIHQKTPLGTGHAILQAEPYIKGRFIAMNGDDLYSSLDIKSCLDYSLCSLAHPVEDTSQYGIFKVDKNNKLLDLVEKPQKKIGSNLANTGLYVLDTNIFPILKNIRKSPRGEIEITDAILSLSKQEDFHVYPAKDYWFPLTYPWSLLSANEYFISKIKKSVIKGKVEKGVTIKGFAIVGKNTVLKAGTYIEGPVVIGESCELGPNCYLRKGTTLGDGCKIGQSVEIKNTIVLDNTKIPHLSYIGDSIIGENTNLGAGTTTANLKHDNSNVRSTIKGVLIDTGRRKLGTIIGDNVHTGINTTIYPGRKIYSNCSTLPGEIVRKDIG